MDSAPDRVGTEPAWWRSRAFAASAAGLAVFVVVAGLWSAHAQDDLPPSLPLASATVPALPSPSSGPATPKITIELTPTWESAPDLAALGALWLSTAGLPPALPEPGSYGPSDPVDDPVLLAGPGSDGARFRQLDPMTGSWGWVTSNARSSVTWSRTTAVFSGDAVDANGAALVRGPNPTVRAVDADGHQVFGSRTGLAVSTSPSRIVLRDGRRLTALSPDGRVTWRALLPVGVRDVAPSTSPLNALVFTSETGPARVSVVSPADGTVTTHRTGQADPGAFSTAAGTLVGDPGDPGTITRYDTAWKPQWTISGPWLIEDVSGGLVLLSNHADDTLAVVGLRDGRMRWTSDPMTAPVTRAMLTQTNSDVMLVSVDHPAGSGEGTAVLAVDPQSGGLLWQVGDRQVIAGWRDYVILAETGGPVLSALGVTDGTSFATLNASTVVSPRTSALVGDTLIYLDGRTGTARAVQLGGP